MALFLSAVFTKAQRTSVLSSIRFLFPVNLSIVTVVDVPAKLFALQSRANRLNLVCVLVSVKTLVCCGFNLRRFLINL